MTFVKSLSIFGKTKPLTPEFSLRTRKARKHRVFSVGVGTHASVRIQRVDCQNDYLHLGDDPREARCHL